MQEVVEKRFQLHDLKTNPGQSGPSTDVHSLEQSDACKLFASHSGDEAGFAFVRLKDAVNRPCGKLTREDTCNYGVFLSILEIVLFFKPRFSKKKTKKTTPHNIPDAARLTAGGRVTLNPGQGRGPRVSSSTAEQARFNRHVRRSTGRNAAFFRRPARFSEHGVRLAATACLPARFRPDCILSNSPARWCRARRRTRSECSPCRWRR